MIGLGVYPITTLAQARKTALANAKMVRAGQDPRKGSGVPTFEKAADEVIRIRAKGWKPGSPTAGRLAGRVRNVRVPDHRPETC